MWCVASFLGGFGSATGAFESFLNFEQGRELGCLGKITWRLDAQNRTNKQSEKNKEKSEAFGEDNKNFSFQHSHRLPNQIWIHVTPCDSLRGHAWMVGYVWYDVFCSSFLGEKTLVALPRCVAGSTELFYTHSGDRLRTNLLFSTAIGIGPQYLDIKLA